jgi:hypothetical protein
MSPPPIPAAITKAGAANASCSSFADVIPTNTPTAQALTVAPTGT